MFTLLLVLTAILAVVTTAVFSWNRLQTEITRIKQSVSSVVNDRLARSRQNSHNLATKLVEGQTSSTTVFEWQSQQAEIYPEAISSPAWAWSNEQLRDWGQAEIVRLSDDVRSKMTKKLVAGFSTLLLATAIPATWLYYRAAAADQVLETVTTSSNSDSGWMDKLLDKATNYFTTESDSNQK